MLRKSTAEKERRWGQRGRKKGEKFKKEEKDMQKGLHFLKSVV
jgi:hypothetical protein